MGENNKVQTNQVQHSDLMCFVIKFPTFTVVLNQNHWDLYKFIEILQHYKLECKITHLNITLNTIRVFKA